MSSRRSRYWELVRSRTRDWLLRLDDAALNVDGDRPELVFGFKVGVEAAANDGKLLQPFDQVCTQFTKGDIETLQEWMGSLYTSLFESLNSRIVNSLLFRQ